MILKWNFWLPGSGIAKAKDGALRALVPRFVFGLISIALATSVLTSTPVFAAELARRSLELELEDVPGVKGYEIRVTKILDNGSKKTPVIFKIKGATWSAKLLPGKYQMEVRSLDLRNVPGQWSPS